jgi:hypothetical protein
MIGHPEIWAIIQSKMAKGRWVPLNQVYEIVKANALLDSEDFEPESPTSDKPKWMRNVRNVLQYRKDPDRNQIQWNGEGLYRLDS